MKKMYVKQYDPTGIVISEFEVIPTKKSDIISRSRIVIENGDGLWLMSLSLHDDDTVEIINEQTIENDFDAKLNEAIINQNKINDIINYFTVNVDDMSSEQLDQVKQILNIESYGK